ncbi:MAG: isocitrate/isopropylmalate family dehydrogenase [Bryobacteraceae bacterium]|nr:isocitrate/isopropylmalate family dehydrogenase [Bryobacteraceae bacterium]
MRHRVAVAAGDGIGPELTEATQRVLESAGARIEWIDTPVGKAAVGRYGEELPSSSLVEMKLVGVVLDGPSIETQMYPFPYYNPTGNSQDKLYFRAVLEHIRQKVLR